MKIVRNERYIEKRKVWSKYLSIAGFIFLATGFVVLFIDQQSFNPLMLQTTALILGWLLSQAGLYFAHRFFRTPRPDEVLDRALRGTFRDATLYHYHLPAPHVLLTKSGPIVFNLKYQGGKISADGERWRQGGSIFKRWFGQEGIGRPHQETEQLTAALASYINNEARVILDLNIAAMIVFTGKNHDLLDVENASIPSMHYSKVKGYLNSNAGQPMPSGDYEALKFAFDVAARGN